MRVGVAHHFGWAVVVTATADHRVVDRRRVELVEPGVPAAPVHHGAGMYAMHSSGEAPDDEALAELVAVVRASAVRAASVAFDRLATEVPGSVRSLSVRAWPAGFPTEVAVLRRPPYESRADSVMYCQVVAEVAQDRGWPVHGFDARTVEAEAAQIVGARAGDVLSGPRRTLGPPWSKDHRVALAATIVAASIDGWSE